MRRSRLCSTKICESNRKCNVLIKDDGSDGVWEAQTRAYISQLYRMAVRKLLILFWMKTTMGIMERNVRVFLNATFNFTIFWLDSIYKILFGNAYPLALLS